MLDDIEGIGPARRKALMRRYQSLEKIKEADVEDLMQTETMNEKQHRQCMHFSTLPRRF